MRLRLRRDTTASEKGLEARWEHVRLLERLPQPRGRGGVTARQLSEGARALRDLAPLEKWPRISEASFRTYGNPANHVRLRRLLDFARDGDRVLDVGFGFGYVTGILLRERRLEHYCGIDLKEQFVGAVASMAEANRLDLSACHLEVRDAFDITPEWMAGQRPDLVLILEVLEHVAAPEEALAAVARGLPEHATVLFTVPLLGRLEGVWGHLSLFDRGRVEQMCERAGLVLHHVEPLHATWMLVAASPSPVPPERLSAAVRGAPGPSARLRRAAAGLPDPRYPSLSVTQVPIGGSHDYARPQDDPAQVSRQGPPDRGLLRRASQGRPSAGRRRAPAHARAGVRAAPAQLHRAARDRDRARRRRRCGGGGPVDVDVGGVAAAHRVGPADAPAAPGALDARVPGGRAGGRRGRRRARGRGTRPSRGVGLLPPSPRGVRRAGATVRIAA